MQFPFRIVSHKRDHSPNILESSKRLRESGRNDFWLRDLHAGLWDKESRRAELFRQVTITAGHYTKLQQRLNECIPNRKEEDYIAGDVQSLKLEILRSCTPDDEHLSAEDLDDELLSFFPATIDYLDLSCLQITYLERMPVPLYIREEYGEISKNFAKQRKWHGSSGIISGQPGTGEILVLGSFFGSDNFGGNQERLLTFTSESLRK